MARHDDAEPAAMLRAGLEMVRKGRAMIRAAENMGAVAHLGPAAGNARSVDFAAIPGHSPEARAEAIYVGRRMRDSLFPDGLFGEPAWDILLAVFLAHSQGKDADASEVLLECNVPKSTGMRVVALLIERGLIVNQTDDEEPNRVALSTTALRAMRRFFEVTEGGVPVRTASITPRRLTSGD